MDNLLGGCNIHNHAAHFLLHICNHVFHVYEGQRPHINISGTLMEINSLAYFVISQNAFSFQSHFGFLKSFLFKGIEIT